MTKLAFLSKWPKIQLNALVGLVNFLFTLSQFISKNRISHNNGLLTKAKIRIIEKPDFPSHDFFRPGLEFNGIFRFSTVRLLDDAVLAVRGVSVKFADNKYKSPLDLELNTGRTPLFSNADNFMEFIDLTVKGSREHFLPYWEKYPHFRAAAEDSVRRCPLSFLQMYYYSQTPNEFKTESGERYYVKYRLIPSNRDKESGLPSSEDLETLHIQDVIMGEIRSPNYLKDELRARVDGGDASMILQLQLRPILKEDSIEIVNPNKPWDEIEFPWVDLAMVELQSYCDYKDGQSYIFSIGQHPKSLGLLEAKNIHDYNSICIMRSKSMMAKKARLLAYKLFSIPDSISNKRDKKTLYKDIKPYTDSM